MKYTKYILLLVLSIFIFTNTNAQKKKINSGFVFIDGKYIEPPYTVKQKEPGKIYINGIYVLNKIRGLDTVLNPYEIKELPLIPKSITKNTSFKELTELRHGKFSYLSAVSYYYYTHLPGKEADKKMYEYLIAIPCIKSINKGTFEFYNGDKKHMSIGPFMIKGFYERFGIHSKRKLPTKKEIRKREEHNTVSVINTELSRNKMFCYNTKPIKNYFYRFSESQIINGSKKIKNKKTTYIDIREVIKSLWENYELEYTPKVENRIKEIKEIYIKEGKFKTDTFNKKE